MLVQRPPFEQAGDHFRQRQLLPTCETRCHSVLAACPHCTHLHRPCSLLTIEIISQELQWHSYQGVNVCSQALQLLTYLMYDRVAHSEVPLPRQAPQLREQPPVPRPGVALEQTGGASSLRKPRCSNPTPYNRAGCHLQYTGCHARLAVACLVAQ